MYKYLFVLLSFCSVLSTNGQNYGKLGTYDNQGLPSYLINPRDVVSTAFLNRINASLPERYPVPSYNPHYITAGTQTNIEISGLDSADVWITFVAEGAGYRNTLGFYTYDISNPPTTPPTNPQIKLVFPNVSAAGSGGSLIAGDKVLLGRFGPGTGIGWVLLANAWNNPSTNPPDVGPGLWKLYSNYLFNPEASLSLKYHNVLLFDQETQRVVLGFEDIRRDNSGCDNDFNDAIFYITATPNTAINLTNINETSEVGEGVSTGNSGGLESEGSLAQKIASRNVSKELLSPKKNFDDPKKLQRFHGLSSSSILEAYVPDFGLDSSTAYVTTPADLLQLTNAVDVFSIDYFVNSNRKAVCLSTKTLSSVYVHTKSICDRVGGASLEKTNQINILGEYPATLITLRKNEGILEYAMSFSFQKQSDNSYNYHSHWNINDFPTNSEYINFQIWGVKPSEVYFLAEKVIGNFDSLQVLNSTTYFTPPPPILLKAGQYNQGRMNLSVTNHPKTAGLLHIWGTYRENENGNSKPFDDTIAISNQLSQAFSIEKNGIFDAGFNIQRIGSPTYDSFYLADGAWVENYEGNNVSNLQLQTYPQNRLNQGENQRYWVERSLKANGNVKNYYSLHRPLKLGLKSVDLSAFQFLHFNASGSRSVEVVLSKASVSNWSEQARIWVNLTSESKNFYINLNDFKDINNQTINLSDINAVTFSVTHDNISFVPFEIKLNNIAFTHTGNCEQTPTILGDTYTNEKYVASAHMIVQNKNNSNSNVLYTSANSIELKPGFSAENGSIIVAEIKGCND